MEPKSNSANVEGKDILGMSQIDSSSLLHIFSRRAQTAMTSKGQKSFRQPVWGLLDQGSGYNYSTNLG